MDYLVLFTFDLFFSEIIRTYYFIFLKWTPFDIVYTLDILSTHGVYDRTR